MTTNEAVETLAKGIYTHPYLLEKDRETCVSAIYGLILSDTNVATFHQIMTLVNKVKQDCRKRPQIDSDTSNIP